MPVGIPKVIHRYHGERYPQWIDIYARLSRERVLFLTQNVEENMIHQLIGLVLYLSSEDTQYDIFIYINVVIKMVIEIFSLVDTIQYVRADINTINMGTSTSIATFVRAGGQNGKRLALSHARFRINPTKDNRNGQATEIFVEIEEVLRLQRTMRQLYSKFTGQLLNRILTDLDRDIFLNAKQACEYGFIDLVKDHE